MSNNIKILNNYILYFLTMLLVCIVGISDIFADEILDTSTWIGVTGRVWSISTQEYTFANPVADNNWSKSAYNVVSGIYTPPSSYDYITFSYFQHQGGYNPCNGGNYRTSFKIKFSTPSYVNYVNNIQFADNNCSYVVDSSTGIVSSNCIINYSLNQNVYVGIFYNDINGNSSSDLYISRYIDVSCDLNTSAITDNATENTQNIINNNNQNTQNIINNQNSNTQQQIESQKVCNKTIIDKNSIFFDGRILNSSGTFSPTSTWGVTDYIEIFGEIIIKISEYSTSQNGAYLWFYDIDKNIISGINNKDLITNQQLTIPTNAKYVRFSINKSSNIPQFEITKCINGNQAVSDSINGLNDSINDDDSSGASSEASDFFSSFTTNTFGLTSIITAPLNLIQSLTSSTCSSLHLPLPYLDNKYLDLPCMSSIYSQYFGSFFTIYQTITYGIIAYWVCVRIFNLVKDFKNPEHDEIEVVDL